jgi:hypothetical protein
MNMVKDPKKIDRVALTHVDDIEAQLRGVVLEKARVLFDYKADSFGAVGPLAETLVALDIRPLKREQVDAYKKRTTRTKEINPAARAVRAWVTLAITLALLNGAGLVTPPFITFSDSLDRWLCSLTLFIIVGGFFGLIISSVTEHLWGGAYTRTWSWRTQFLTTTMMHKGFLEANPSRYEGYVPIHALNLAVQVKEALPSVKCLVHELVYDDTAPAGDPFLEVVYGAERYYIAVWDERDFEAKE